MRRGNRETGGKDMAVLTRSPEGGVQVFSEIADVSVLGGKVCVQRVSHCVW